MDTITRLMRPSVFHLTGLLAAVGHHSPLHKTFVLQLVELVVEVVAVQDLPGLPAMVVLEQEEVEGFTPEGPVGSAVAAVLVYTQAILVGQAVTELSLWSGREDYHAKIRTSC